MTAYLAGLAAGALVLAALPATIRVNVAGLGTTYAVIGSTGTLTVTQPDGTLVYRGIARTVARRNVRRIDGAPLAPQPATDPEERFGRAHVPPHPPAAPPRL